MNERRTLALRKEHLSELTSHELRNVAGAAGDCIYTTCPDCRTIATCVETYTIATCTCPTGASCTCPTG